MRSQQKIDRRRIQETGPEIIYDSLSKHVRIGKVKIPVHAAIDRLREMLKPRLARRRGSSVCRGEGGQIGLFKVRGRRLVEGNLFELEVKHRFQSLCDYIIS